MATRDELTIEATDDNLSVVQEFVEKRLNEVGCPFRAAMQIAVAVEEVFVNIAHYAYHPGRGNAKLRVEVTENPLRVLLTFIDKGIPFDPLAREDPDITLPVEKRKIGGLGIFMTKKMMDDVFYEYRDGSNILTIRKDLE